jgi:hypothetical protein
MKNIYEIFDEFEEAKNKNERMNVIGNNLSQTLVDVLTYTFHPDYHWLINEMPENFQFKETPPGMGYAQISTELRKLYLFRKNNIQAERLSVRKRNEILLQLLESLEPREAEVLIGIFKKDQGVKHLDYKFVKGAFPNLFP